MSIDFYKNLLPSSGTYCVAVLPAGENAHMRHIFVDTIEELVDTIKDKRDDNHVFIGMASFDGHSRKNSKYLKSFFVDLDVGETKDFNSKQEALDELEKLKLNSLYNSILFEPNLADFLEIFLVFNSLQIL